MVAHLPRTCYVLTKKSAANIDQADALIKENIRITINELPEPLGINAGIPWGIQKCVQGKSQDSS